MFLSIVIPVYNEEKKIKSDLNTIFGYLKHTDYSFEVIVVNDGSNDKTLQVVRDYDKNFNSIEIISYDYNRGKGFAVKKGVLHSKGNYIIFVDAGSCVPMEEIEKGLKILRSGYDVAVGSRAIPNSKILIPQPLYRKIGSKVFEFLMHNFFIGLPDIKDIQCGFKLFKRKPALRLFNHQKANGFMFDIDILCSAKKCKYKIKEFPIRWSNDPDTRFKPVSGSFRNLLELIKIKLSY